MRTTQAANGKWVSSGFVGGRLRAAEGSTRKEAWSELVELIKDISKQEAFATSVTNKVIKSNPNYEWNTAKAV